MQRGHSGHVSSIRASAICSQALRHLQRTLTQTLLATGLYDVIDYWFFDPPFFTFPFTSARLHRQWAAGTIPPTRRDQCTAFKWFCFPDPRGGAQKSQQDGCWAVWAGARRKGSAGVDDRVSAGTGGDIIIHISRREVGGDGGLAHHGHVSELNGYRSRATIKYQPLFQVFFAGVV